ncbi:MAG TPA: hypothetical protein VFZ61_06265 [Polyangiales bacterium]
MAKDEHREPADFDDTGESSHAADEPTAVWDMETLRKAGLGDLANLPEAPDAAPATPADGMQRPSVIVDEPAGATKAGSPAAGKPETGPQQPVASTGNSWWGLLVMALALGVAAYFAIRALR